MKLATLLINSKKDLDDPELRFIYDILYSHLINFEIEHTLNDECVIHIKYDGFTEGSFIYEGLMDFIDGGKIMRLVVYYGSDVEAFEEISIEDAGVVIAHSILQNDYRCRHCVVNTRDKLKKEEKK